MPTKASLLKTVSASSVSPLFSAKDLSTVARYLNRTVNDVQVLIQEKGASIVSGLFGAAKASASTASNNEMTPKVQSASPAFCTDISRNIHRGDESPMTSLLQVFLADKGFLQGEPSGFFGDLTIEAVKAYQRSLGLPETGMVYDFTRQAIKDATCN